MSHPATQPQFVDNGAGLCWHCGRPEAEHGRTNDDRVALLNRQIGEGRTVARMAYAVRIAMQSGLRPDFARVMARDLASMVLADTDAYDKEGGHLVA